MVLLTRAISSARVVSVSSNFGGSVPLRRAAAPLAASLAICTWRFSGIMSGYNRMAANTFGSNLRASACATAFSRMLLRLRSVSRNVGIVISYSDTLMRVLQTLGWDLARPLTVDGKAAADPVGSRLERG